MHFTASPAGRPGQHPPLPRRVRTENARISAIDLPSADPADRDWYTAHVYRWAWDHVDERVECADRVARIAVALVANAHRWTRSGLPEGRCELRIHRCRFDIAVSVTDQGTVPAPSGVCTFPVAGPGGGGLRTVDDLAIYWDWEGGAGTPITVRALVDRRPR